MSMQCNAMYFCMGRAEEAGDLGCLRAAFASMMIVMIG